MFVSDGAATALEFIARASRPFDQLTIEEARSALRTLSDSLSVEPEPVGFVEDRVVSFDGLSLRFRIYWPQNSSDEARPLVLMMHGGGWVLGDLETHDRSARSLCNAASAVVAALDYRRPPEHRYPAALEDTYAALRWASANAASLGADPGRIVLVGDSAGGNLAAAASILARDRGGPSVAGQILIYPALDVRCSSDSFRDFADGYFLTLEKMRWYWRMYLPDGDPGTDPLASPTLADDLSGLPSTLVITAGLDPLRDEGEGFAVALQKAGVAATVRRYDGVIHAFTLMSALMPEARQAIDECGAFIKNNTARPADPSAAVMTSDMSRRRVASASTYEEQYAFSRVVTQDDWVFVAGTTGFDYHTASVPDGVVEQAEQCFTNITAALSTVDATLDDAVRVTYYFPDISDFAVCAPLIRQKFQASRPVATTVQAGLLDPRLKIEIEVTAIRRRS